MSFFTRNPKFFLKCLAIFFVITGIAAYSLFQARNVIRGPIIKINSPSNGVSVKDSMIEIKGLAKNISFISLNGKQIFVDKNGNFNEKIILASGYNALKMAAKDKFGRLTEKSLEIVLSRPDDSPETLIGVVNEDNDPSNTASSTESGTTTTKIVNKIIN